MKKLVLIALALAALALPAFAQPAHHAAAQSFASDYQTVPVMGNTAGANGATFQTYVALFNPTSASFPVDATLYDAAGGKHTATIALGAGELKTYPNFLDAVFNYSGGGAVTFKAPQHDQRFIVSAEVWTSGARFGTTVPVLEFAGTSSRSFAAGISVDSAARTNIGCFNQSDAPNAVTATVYDKSKTVVTTVNLNLPGHAWAQAPVAGVVSDGYVQFDPADSAVCYAVVISNATNDGRFVSAAEYQP